MFKLVPLAHSLGALSGLCYIAAVLVSSAAPNLYTAMHSAKYMGTNVGSRPVTFDIMDLIVVIIMGWIGGYVWGWLYNRFAR